MPASHAPHAPSFATLNQAAEWFALLRSGEASPADRSQWQAWLASSPEHREAWQRVERISGCFEPIQAMTEPRAAIGALGAAGSRMRRRVVTSLATLAGGCLLGWSAWRHGPLPELTAAWHADHRSASGEIREIALADGSRVWLASGSAIDEDFQGELRRLRLLAGEILVQTAADPRAFVVDTPQGRLRALGTRFTARLDGSETLLAVYEGAVEIRTENGNVAVVEAGSQRRFTATAIAGPDQADPAREAWAKGILIARDIPLAEVVGELRRYRGGWLGVAPEVANLPVFGSYPLNDPDRALNMLASVLPIRIRHTLPWWVSVEPVEAPPRQPAS